MLDADNTKGDAPYLWRETETARNVSSQLEMRGKRDGRKKKKEKRCEREAAAGGGGGGSITNIPAAISQFKVLMILKMLI